ncbi:hypothetical protein Cgig2_001592 [Carnegiea gigantea]|uniref:Uncharacterized protein n=1 Tax=Carnegiea gigantea TaxID=171969 RepID=A0A9Q1KBL7_9CARY|nr:hypothetical protein Cgig2_001592 [Carnegiea gigantea]
MEAIVKEEGTDMESPSKDIIFLSNSSAQIASSQGDILMPKEPNNPTEPLRINATLLSKIHVPNLTANNVCSLAANLRFHECKNTEIVTLNQFPMGQKKVFAASFSHIPRHDGDVCNVLDNGYSHVPGYRHDQSEEALKLYKCLHCLGAKMSSFEASSPSSMIHIPHHIQVTNAFIKQFYNQGILPRGTQPMFLFFGEANGRASRIFFLISRWNVIIRGAVVHTFFLDGVGKR